MISLTSSGSISGSFWSLLIGIFFFMPIVGAAIAAASGALAGTLSYLGVDDNFTRELGETVRPETSALFVLVRQVTSDQVLAEVAPYGGKVLRTSLSKDDEGKLQEGLSGQALAAESPSV